MRTARDHTGCPLEAAPGAPEQAICPHCGGEVLLRRRRNHPPGDVVYFWRHRDHDNAGCPARVTVGIRKAKGAEYPDLS